MAGASVYNGQLFNPVNPHMKAVGATAIDPATNNVYFGNAQPAGSYSNGNYDWISAPPQFIQSYNHNAPLTPIPSIEFLPFDFEQVATTPLGVTYYWVGNEVGILDTNYQKTPLLTVDWINGLFLEGETLYVYGSFHEVYDLINATYVPTGSVVSVVGQTISLLDVFFDGEVYIFGIKNGSMYVGSDATDPNYGVLPLFAFYDGNNWSDLSPLPGNTLVDIPRGIFVASDTVFILAESDGTTCVWTDDGTGNPTPLGDMIAAGFTTDSLWLTPSAWTFTIHQDIPYLNVQSLYRSTSPFTFPVMIKYDAGQWQSVGNELDVNVYVDSVVYYSGAFYSSFKQSDEALYQLRILDNANTWTHLLDIGSIGNYEVYSLVVFNSLIHGFNCKLTNANPVGNAIDYSNIPTTIYMSNLSAVYSHVALDSANKVYAIFFQGTDIVINEQSTPTIQNPTVFYLNTVTYSFPAANGGELNGFEIDTNDKMYIIEKYLDVNTEQRTQIYKFNRDTVSLEDVFPTPNLTAPGKLSNIIFDINQDIIYAGTATFDSSQLIPTFDKGIFRIDATTGEIVDEGLLTNYDLGQSAFGWVRYFGGVLYCAGKFYDNTLGYFVPLISLDTGTWTTACDTDISSYTFDVRSFVFDSTGIAYISDSDGFTFMVESNALQPLTIECPVSGQPQWRLAVDTNDQVYASGNSTDLSFLYKLVLDGLVWKWTKICSVGENVEFNSIISHPTLGVIVTNKYTNNVYQYNDSYIIPGTFYGQVDSLVVHNNKLYVSSRQGSLGGSIVAQAGIFSCNLTTNAWQADYVFPYYYSETLKLKLFSDGSCLYVIGGFTDLGCGQATDIAVLNASGNFIAVGNNSYPLNPDGFSNITKNGNSIYVSYEFGGEGV